jgi:hypothetical protein
MATNMSTSNKRLTSKRRLTAHEISEFGFFSNHAIEDHKLDITFLHIAFGSQSLLEPTNDQTGSDIN